MSAKARPPGVQSLRGVGQLPRHPLRVPRCTHLGVEAVGFAELALVRVCVALQVCQLGAQLVDVGLVDARLRLYLPSRELRDISETGTG